MNKSLIILAIILVSTRLLSQEKIELFLNPQDCINCRLISPTVYDYYKGNVIIFIPPSFITDSSLIRQSFKLPPSVKINIAKASKEPRSYYKKYSDNLLVDSNSLAKLQVSLDNSVNQCFKELSPAYTDYSISDKNIIVKDIAFGRIKINNKELDNSFELKNLLITELHYKTYYNHNYQAPLDKINEYKSILNNLTDQLIDAVYIDNKIYLTTSTPFLFPYPNSTDTLINRIQFLDIFDNNFKHLNTFILKDTIEFYHKGKLYINEGVINIAIQPINKDNFKNIPLIAQYVIKNEKLILSKIINLDLPKTYVNNGLNFNFLTPIFSENWVTHSFSNEMTNMHDNRKIDLNPTKEDLESISNLYEKFKNIESQSFYRVLDIKAKNEFINVLYFDAKNNLLEKIINVNTQRLIENSTIIHNLSNENLQMLPKYANDKVIYKLKNEDCFRIISGK